jgi:hypothetical protein
MIWILSLMFFRWRRRESATNGVSASGVPIAAARRRGIEAATWLPRFRQMLSVH